MNNPKCNFLITFIAVIVVLLMLTAIMLDYNSLLKERHYYNQYLICNKALVRSNDALERSNNIHLKLLDQIAHQDSIIKILNDEVARLHGRPIASFYKPKN